MNIILLSGGSGKRLWPLSNDIRSKQFIKIFKKEDGTYESMVQRMYRQIKAVDPSATVTIATSKTQVSAINNQLGEDVGISIEPCRRDTFPAIALATAYLADVMKVPADEAVVVCPVDPYVEEDYFAALKTLCDRASTGCANLVLMGMEPTYPSEKYGYIIASSRSELAQATSAKQMLVVDQEKDSRSELAQATKQATKEYENNGAFEDDLTSSQKTWRASLPEEVSHESGNATLGNERECLLGRSTNHPKEVVRFYKVKSFEEKPDLETAKTYLSRGALWNGGVFAYRLSYVLNKAHELIDFTDYNDLYAKYESLDKISFDYAVVEKEPNIEVMPFSGQWKDLGTWNTLTEAMEEPVIGEAVLNDNCEDVHVINELNVPVLAMGIRNAVICASAQGILVSDKQQSSYIKPFVDKIDQQIMFSEKSWGSYRVIAVEEGSMTVMVTLNPGHGMHYHSHKLRDEVWTVIEGEGMATVDNVSIPVHAGDVVRMRAGQKHKVCAKTELKIIEVQIGNEISVHDKEKF